MPTPETSGKDWSQWRAKTPKATEQAVVVPGAEEIFQGSITTRSSIGRKEYADPNYDYDTKDPNISGGPGLPNEGARNIKTASAKAELQRTVGNLKHEVDMDNAIELGATGTDDEPFVIEHDPQLHK